MSDEITAGDVARQIQRGTFGWLTRLVEGAADNVACVGGGKLEMVPRWVVLLKDITNVKKHWRQMWGGMRHDFYVRTICALYRTAALRDESLRFVRGIEQKVTCGKQMYYDLIDRGYGTRPLPESEMGRDIFHLAHATMVLNSEFTVRPKTERKYYRRIKAVMDSPEIQDVLNDDSLDA